MDPAVVQRPGGKVEWIKEKGPEHGIFEYYIYCWLGRDAFSKHRELFSRIQASSHELISLAIICRSYSTTRNTIQVFHETYLTGPTIIPLVEWNANYQLLEEAVVGIESFFWFANRLLTHVAQTLNYFFKKVKRQAPNGMGVRSHSTFVDSAVCKLLPSDLQDEARQLKARISDFRNADIEHDMKYWRTRKAVFSGQTTGEERQVKINFPPTTAVHPEKPLRELWIEIHDYLTEVAKYIGSQLDGL